MRTPRLRHRFAADTHVAPAGRTDEGHGTCETTQSVDSGAPAGRPTARLRGRLRCGNSTGSGWE